MGHSAEIGQPTAHSLLSIFCQPHQAPMTIDLNHSSPAAVLSRMARTLGFKLLGLPR
jgi:hypothetical protein